MDQCSVLRNFKKLFSADYSNAVIVASACLGGRLDPPSRPTPGHRWWQSQQQEMVPEQHSHLPFALLKEEGWRKASPTNIDGHVFSAWNTPCAGDMLAVLHTCSY